MIKNERTPRVIALLDKSYHAYIAGDTDEAGRLGDEAANVDHLVYAVITGAMRMGDIPNPEIDPDGWDAFVVANT